MNNHEVNQDHFWLQQALELAKTAAKYEEVPVGAVIVAENQIIATGHNQPITTCDPTAHAEIIALREAAKQQNNYRLTGAALYVTLEPCAMCLGAMLQARVSRLVFGAYDPRAGAVTSVFQLLAAPELNHRMHWQGGVLADECGEILKDFFRERR